MDGVTESKLDAKISRQTEKVRERGREGEKAVFFGVNLSS
jgi:uncharacterized protein YabE (DUF348 family)